jgi:predicted transcriptional regulator
MKKDIRKSIRISEDENSKLSEMLKEHNLKFSDFARSRILGYKIKSKIDQSLIFEINKIGNNLNQLAKLANQNKSIEVEVLQSLVSIEKKLESLTDDL